MPVQTIAGGATSAVIAGGFGPPPYQLSLEASWPTDISIVAETPSAATLVFSVPAPPGGGKLYFNPQFTSTAQPISATALSIPAGDISAVVFMPAAPDGAQPEVTVSWPTAWSAPAFDGGETTVNFNVPAPPGGGTLYITAIPLPEPIESGEFATLDDYLNELRRLLHDPLDQYFPLTVKVPNINKALQRRDVDTAANRQLRYLVLTIGKDTYVFSDLGGFGPPGYAPIITLSWATTRWIQRANAQSFEVDFAVPVPPGGGEMWWSVPLVAATGTVPPTTTHVSLAEGLTSVTITAPPAPKIFDVVGINLVYIAQRVVLLNMSFTRLNTTKRPWIPYQGIVEGWCRYGTSQVVFGPQPSLNYLTEWDVCIYSDPMVALTDRDAVPFPYTLRLVPMYAAYLCKLNERQYDEADKFLGDYMREADVARNQRVGLLPSAYGKVGSYS